MDAKVKEIQVWNSILGETEPATAVFDGRDWWVREVAEKHYVGTYGRNTPIYGSNPDGVCYYKVAYDPLANGYVECENKDGSYEKRSEGQEFKKLQTIFFCHQFASAALPDYEQLNKLLPDDRREDPQVSYDREYCKAKDHLNRWKSKSNIADDFLAGKFKGEFNGAYRSLLSYALQQDVPDSREFFRDLCGELIIQKTVERLKGLGREDFAEEVQNDPWAEHGYY